MGVIDPIGTFAKAQKLIGEGLSIRRAADAVGVSKSWLDRRIQGKCEVAARNGPNPVLLPDEEQALVDNVIHRAAAGYGLTKQDLKEQVKLIAADGRTTPWNGKGPGKKWLKGFLERCKGKLSLRKTRILDSNRRAAGDAAEIASYFAAAKAVLDDHDITPERLFNCDETGKGYLASMQHQTHTYTRAISASLHAGFTPQGFNSENVLAPTGCKNVHANRLSCSCIRACIPAHLVRCGTSCLSLSAQSCSFLKASMSNVISKAEH
jgi:Tc5 transposase DNA-binding domain